LDQRGHGGSTNSGDPAGYTLEQLTADLAAALTQLGVERCDLLGHSMGGMVALRFALAHPERLSSLVLMDTAARGLDGLAEPVKRLMEGAATLARRVGMGAVANLMRPIVQNPGFALSMRRGAEAGGFDNSWDRIQAKLEKMDPEAFATLGPALMQQDSLVDRLKEIHCPTTVIVGAEDLLVLEPSRELAGAIPGAVLVEIPDAAHNPQLENPKAWSEAIRNHLATARRGL
jgi:pimeloyl-ACP methyl ester carboxylesterase